MRILFALLALLVRPKIEGRVVIRLMILPNGQVYSSEIIESEIKDRRVPDHFSSDSSHGESIATWLPEWVASECKRQGARRFG